MKMAIADPKAEGKKPKSSKQVGNQIESKETKVDFPSENS
jgi:hypothetical protein